MGGLGRLQLGDPVPFVDENEARTVKRGLLGGHFAVGGEDDQVSRAGEVGGGAVDLDRPGARFPLDGVGREARPSGDVVDLDTFVREDSGGGQERPVDRDGPLVVEVGAGDGGAVDLGLEHRELHRSPPEDDVVDETGPAELHGGGEEDGTVDPLDGPHRGGVDEVDGVEGDEGLGLESEPERTQDFRRFLLPQLGDELCDEESPEESGRGRPLGRA